MQFLNAQKGITLTALTCRSQLIARHLTRDDFMAAGGSSLVARYPEDVQLEALWQAPAVRRKGKLLEETGTVTVDGSCTSHDDDR